MALYWDEDRGMWVDDGEGGDASPPIPYSQDEPQPIRGQTASAVLGAPALYGALDYGQDYAPPPQQARRPIPFDPNIPALTASGRVMSREEVLRDEYESRVRRGEIAPPQAQPAQRPMTAQERSVQENNARADQWYGTQNGGQPDLSGANAPSIQDFSVNTLRGGRAGHTDFVGGQKVNDYQPGYTTGQRIIPERVVWAPDAHGQMQPRVVAPRQIIPGRAVPQQGYASREEQEIAEAKARGELAPSERKDLLQYQNSVAGIDKKVANLELDPEDAAPMRAELLNRIKSLKLRDQIMQEESHRRAETKFQREQALLQTVDTQNRIAAAKLIEQGHTLVERTDPVTKRTKFYTVDPKSGALTEAFGDDEEKSFEKQHGMWLKHQEMYLRHWEKTREQIRKRNEDAGASPTEDELNAAADRETKFPKPSDEPVPPWIQRQQRQQPAANGPQPGVVGQAPQQQRPAAMHAAPEVIRMEGNRQIAELESRKDLHPDVKRRAMTAVSLAMQLIEEAGGVGNMNARQRAEYENLKAIVRSVNPVPQAAPAAPPVNIFPQDSSE